MVLSNSFSFTPDADFSIVEISAQPRRPLQDRRAPSTFDYTTEYPLSPLSNNVTNATTNTNNITFPPQPHPTPPPLSSSPSSTASRAATNALNRALSIASKKLFGHSPSPGHSRGSSSRDYNTSSAPSSPRRPQIITLDADAERDPLEDELLASLEELAQKTDVLTRWADEMYEYVKAIPQSWFSSFFFD
jgi:serine/threonine-protein kinase ULK2